MKRATATLGGVLVLALLAGVLTEATMAQGNVSKLADDTLFRPAGTSTPTPSASPTATPTPTPTATPTSTPTPTATPIPTPSGPTATTSSFVRLRAGNSTNTAVLAELNGGTVVELLPVSDSQWQQVRVNGQVGYVYKLYLTY